MSKINEIKEEQFQQLLKAYFAPPEKRTKLTIEELKDLAQRLNEQINVPIIKETKEEKILLKIIIKIDGFLYDNLPNEFYDLLGSLDKGIDDEEAKRLIKRLSKLANKHIDIPYVPEKMEYIAIRFITGLIINAARKNWDLDKAKTELTGKKIPDKEYATDDELESIIR